MNLPPSGSFSIDKKSEEARYYISSKKFEIQEFSDAVRGHWGIESSFHWVMDIIFRDDECRVREKNASANFVTLKHITLNMLKSLPVKKSMRVRRKRAGWDEAFLYEALLAEPGSLTFMRLPWGGQGDAWCCPLREQPASFRFLPFFPLRSPFHHPAPPLPHAEPLYPLPACSNKSFAFGTGGRIHPSPYAGRHEVRTRYPPLCVPRPAAVETVRGAGTT